LDTPQFRRVSEGFRGFSALQFPPL
jgi:hypothetical protein